VTARDKSANQNETAASAEASAMTDPEDTVSPTPDPMTWDEQPAATGTNSIAMTASVATDDLNDVEYYFTCTAGGGHDNGWRTDTYYEDTGLTIDTEYTYTVTARDTSHNYNETAPSTEMSAFTDPDIVPPTPDPMTWAMVPTPGDFLTSVVYDLTGDETITTTPVVAFGTETQQLAALLNDPFAYDPADPTSPMPQTVWESTIFFNGTYTYLATIAYDFDETYNKIFVDIYGRDGNTFVEARDDSFNVEFWLTGVLQETIASGIDSTHHVRVTASPGTLADSIRIVETAESPNYFALAEIRVNGVDPIAANPTSITMIATEADDVNGVEYYFECTAGGGSDSGWQDSVIYTETGLTPSTTYTYKVMARDKSPAQNATGWSTSESATTD
jgi:hypothetical protein